MILNENDCSQFMRIHPNLMLYVGLREKVLNKKSSIEEIMNLPVEKKLLIWDRFYENIKYLDDFIRENPAELDSEDLAIADKFRHFKRGKFWVVKYLKDHTIFFDDKFAYGVLGLYEPFEWIFEDDLPLMVELVLLPFKDKIVYDGMMGTYPITFGRGTARSINNFYGLAKVKYGIITNLPFDGELAEAKVSDEEMLRYYMKTESLREEYWAEIEELMFKTPALERLIMQLWGKINSRKKKRELKELGIKNCYFAIHDETILASGKNKSELENQLKQMVEKETLAAIHIFKI